MEIIGCDFAPADENVSYVFIDWENVVFPLSVKAFKY